MPETVLFTHLFLVMPPIDGDMCVSRPPRERHRAPPEETKRVLFFSVLCDNKTGGSDVN